MIVSCEENIDDGLLGELIVTSRIGKYEYGVLGMINKIVAITGASIVALGIMSTSSSAATLDFTIDPYIGSAGLFAGTTYSISAFGGTLDNSQLQDGNTCVGLDCTTDGLGVDTGGGWDDDDEISSYEDGDEFFAQSITVTFGEVVNITDLYFLDLFTDDEGTGEPEVARVSYNGTFSDFSADPGQVRFDGSSGFFAATALNILTDELVFTVFNGDLQERGYGDYALAAITGVSAVPLPPALLMFGAAFGGMGLLARRKKKSN